MPQSKLVTDAKEVYSTEGSLALAKAGAHKVWRNVASSVSQLPVADQICYHYSISQLRDRMASEEDLNDIIETTQEYRGLGRYKSIRPLHVMDEFTDLVKEVERQDPDSIIEIGTAEGGSYYVWCRYLDIDEIVCIDFSLTPEYIEFLDYISPNHIDTTFLVKNSLDQRTVDNVGEEITDEVDFIFIDGAGPRDAKMADFENYSQYLSDDGMIAVHDICERPDSPQSGGYEFWQEIKQEYETKEIVGPAFKQYQGQDIHLGIGIIYP